MGSPRNVLDSVDRWPKLCILKKPVNCLLKNLNVGGSAPFRKEPER